VLRWVNYFRVISVEEQIRDKLLLLSKNTRAHVESHLNHFIDWIKLPLVEAFIRGAKAYTGAAHWSGDSQAKRTAEEDIRHVLNCHVSVRLREAEDLASTGNRSKALSKIVSAIGYLVVLHRRVNLREQGQPIKGVI